MQNIAPNRQPSPQSTTHGARACIYAARLAPHKATDTAERVDRRVTEGPVSARHRAIDDIENVRIEMVSRRLSATTLVRHWLIPMSRPDPALLSTWCDHGTEECHPRGESSSPRRPVSSNCLVRLVSATRRTGQCIPLIIAKPQQR